MTAPLSHRHTWRVEGLDCPNCARQLENDIRSQAGVLDVELDFMGGMLTVLCSIDNNCEPLLSEIAAKHGASFHAAEPNAISTPKTEIRRWPTEAWYMLLSGIPLFIGFFTGITAWYLASIIIAGSPVVMKAWQELRLRTMAMNTLMLIAAIGAVSINEHQEGALVLFLFTIARWLERLTSEKARQSIELLKTRIPALAHVIDEHGDFDLPVARVEPGTMIRIKPHERVPLDGRVTHGTSTCDEQILTGESQPVAKQPGATVYAGTFNGDGPLEVETTQSASQSRFSRIIDSVDRIQGQKTKFQSTIERFAEIYTPTVVCLAMALAFLPPFLMQQAFQPWIHSALVLLVVACPCALVLAAPVTQVASIALAARNGILFRSGDTIEAAATIRVVALDKTGTLTHGKPSITRVVPAAGFSESQVMQLATALEVNSEHPLAQAFVDATSAQTELPKVSRFAITPGRGVEGDIDGVTYRLGIHEWATKICTKATPEPPSGPATGTIVTLTSKDGSLATITFSDTLRPEAKTVIDHLGRCGIHHTALLSGDHPEIVEEIGSALGISERLGRCFPEDKQRRLAELRAAHGPVLMLGDGINDAPALAAADLGVAMGRSGTDAVLETAGAVLTQDRLDRLPLLLAISQRCQALIKQNMALAIGLKLAVFGLSLAGMATLWMAVIADTGASVLVVGNGLRALRVPSPFADSSTS